MARRPKATDQDTDPAPMTEEAVDKDLLDAVEATDPLRQPEAEAPPAPPPAADPAPDMPPPPAGKTVEPAPAVRKSSGGGVFVGFVLGAAVAAAAGVVTMRFAPQFLPIPATDLTGVESALTEQQTALAALQSRVEALSAAPAPDAALADRVAKLEAAAPPDVAALTERLDQLSARLDSLPTAPATGGGVNAAELQALRDQIAALQSGTVVSEQASALAAEAEKRLAEARDAAAALTAATQAATAATLRQAALGRLSAAVETGAPYASALAELGEVPPALADHAATGVPSLSRLQDSFPAAARRALEAALTSDMGASWTDRVTNFLRSQTGARSLSPREGNDPDAILSRAEAALTGGDLTAALAEIATLPDAAKAAMADWTAEAETRQQAVQALSALAQQG